MPAINPQPFPSTYQKYLLNIYHLKWHFENQTKFVSIIAFTKRSRYITLTIKHNNFLAGLLRLRNICWMFDLSLDESVTHWCDMYDKNIIIIAYWCRKKSEIQKHTLVAKKRGREWAKFIYFEHGATLFKYFYRVS